MVLVRPVPSFAIEVLPLMQVHSDHSALLTPAAARPNCGEDPEIGAFDARGFMIPPEIARPLLLSSQLILLQARSALILKWGPIPCLDRPLKCGTHPGRFCCMKPLSFPYTLNPKPFTLNPELGNLTLYSGHRSGCCRKCRSPPPPLIVVANRPFHPPLDS